MNALQRILAMPSDSLPKTLFVATALCLVASLVVSTAAVALRPLQAANKLKDKQVNILQVAGLYAPGQDITETFARVEPRLLDLETGEFSDQFDAATFDDRAAADDPQLSRALSDDPASIGSQSRYKTVYLLRDDQAQLDKVILPIHGYGLWSTLYANGELGITVAKVAPPAGDDYHIDSLAGATLTSRGVDNLVRFWMGEQGYSPLLNRLESGETL